MWQTRRLPARIYVIGDAYSSLCVLKFFTDTSVKRFGRDVKESDFVAVFIITMHKGQLD